jgi:hypothetical protein
MTPDRNQRRNKQTDLPDSSRDKEELRADQETRIDLPDVKDIPGQEYVHVPPLREYQDSTASSRDEEGEDVWRDADTNDESTVSDTERQLLRDSANDMPTRDEQSLRRAELDDKDFDGELLNERSSSNAVSGSDLDIPGAEDDDLNEEIGEEDEENNSYSLGGDDQSVNEERDGA